MSRRSNSCTFELSFVIASTGHRRQAVKNTGNSSKATSARIWADVWTAVLLFNDAHSDSGVTMWCCCEVKDQQAGPAIRKRKRSNRKEKRKKKDADRSETGAFGHSCCLLCYSYSGDLKHSQMRHLGGFFPEKAFSLIWFGSQWQHPSKCDGNTWQYMWR